MGKSQGHLASVGAQDRLRGAEKTTARQRKEDLRSVLSTPTGRRFMGYLIWERCRYGEVAFTGNSNTFFVEGQQSVGKDLHDACEALCPELYDMMRAERRAELHDAGLHRQAAQRDAEESDSE